MDPTRERVSKTRDQVDIVSITCHDKEHPKGRSADQGVTKRFVCAIVVDKKNNLPPLDQDVTFAHGKEYPPGTIRV